MTKRTGQSRTEQNKSKQKRTKRSKGLEKQEYDNS